jgi:hypothetical protein
MTWALLLVLIVVAVIFSLSGARHVPWANKLRRSPSSTNNTEWIAPEEVAQRIKLDYMAAIHWLYHSAFQDWAKQWSNAPHYLAGLQLQRHQKILNNLRSTLAPRYIGILRSQHDIEVQYFSADGERCLVLDWQQSRHMSTYDTFTHEFVQSQDLGEGTLVFQMRYDAQARRWKIEQFIQELPLGWTSFGLSRKIKPFSTMPSTLGRDN